MSALPATTPLERLELALESCDEASEPFEDCDEPAEVSEDSPEALEDSPEAFEDSPDWPHASAESADDSAEPSDEPPDAWEDSAELPEEAPEFRDRRVSAELLRRISRRLAGLRDQVEGGSDVAPEVWQHIVHHWLWDRSKGTETTHAGLYEAMRFYSDEPRTHPTASRCCRCQRTRSHRTPERCSWRDRTPHRRARSRIPCPIPTPPAADSAKASRAPAASPSSLRPGP